MFDLEAKLSEILNAHQALEARLSDPALLADRAEYQRVAKRHSDLSAIVDRCRCGH